MRTTEKGMEGNVRGVLGGRRQKKERSNENTVIWQVTWVDNWHWALRLYYISEFPNMCELQTQNTENIY